MNQKPIVEVETLSERDKFNELMITTLRTNQGLNIDKIEAQFGNRLKHHVLQTAEKFIENGNIYLKNNHLILTDGGVFISDSILSELMLVEDEFPPLE